MHFAQMGSAAGGPSGAPHGQYLPGVAASLRGTFPDLFPSGGPPNQTNSPFMVLPNGSRFYLSPSPQSPFSSAGTGAPGGAPSGNSNWAQLANILFANPEAAARIAEQGRLSSPASFGQPTTEADSPKAQHHDQPLSPMNLSPSSASAFRPPIGNLSSKPSIHSSSPDPLR